jgi:uncharacterized protein YjdB
MKECKFKKMIAVFLAVCLTFSGFFPGVGQERVMAASGTIYYVSSTDGDDGNDGLSKSTPWKSLEKVSSEDFQPGDKILFKAGDVWNGSLKLRNISGTEAEPIIFDKYGNDDPNVRPIINGNGTTTTEIFSIYTYYNGVKDKTQSATIDVLDGSYLEINNFEVTNYSDTVISQRAGIAIKTSATNQAEWEANPHKGIVIRNNYVHDVNGNPTGHKVGSGGILLLGNISDALVENNKVVNVDIEGIRNAGLYKEGDIKANFPKVLTNVQFRNNYIEKVQGDGIVMSNVGENGRIEYNTVVDHSYKNVGNVNYAGLWVIGVKDTIAQYNEVYGGKYGYNDGEAFDVDMFSEGMLYQYNYSHDNRGGFMLFMGGSTNSLVRYNISVNDGNGAEIFHYLPSSQNDSPLIHNNTFFTDSHINTKIFSPKTNQYVKLYNNIFMAKGEMTMGSTSFNGGEMKKNVFYPGTDIKGQNFTGITFADNIFESPKLARPGDRPQNIITNLDTFNVDALDGYKLMSSSPLINAGMDVSGLTPSVWKTATKDIFNNDIVGPLDIGAHEYSGDEPEETSPEIEPSSITLDKKELHLYLGHSGVELKATVSPDDAWFKGVKWSSSDPSVASVNADGFVTPISEGTAIITAESDVMKGLKATSTVTVHPPSPVKQYIVASDDAYLSETKNTVQLRLDALLADGNTITDPPYYNMHYSTDHPDALVDNKTGKLTFTGNLAKTDEITVNAQIQEYTNLVYSESFENGWGSFSREQNAPTSGKGGIISDKVAFHGKYSALYDQPPAVEKVFGPNQKGIVTMMFYDDGSKNGRTRVVAHVGNDRTKLMAAMGVFYDGGSVGNLDNYSIRVSGSATAWEKTTIPRAKGWHELKWDYTSGTDLKMYIDGQLVKTTTAIKDFDRINLSFIWDSASGRTFAFDNVKYALSDEKITYQAKELKIPVKVDKTPPVTTAEVTGKGKNNWYHSDVTVTLIGTDNVTGVDRTEYRIGESGDWIPYNSPIALDLEGIHTVQYRSIDQAGNIEEAKQETINIDKTNPHYELGVNGNVLSDGGSFDDYLPLTFKVSDDLSGIAFAKINIDGTHYSFDPNTQSVEIDMAGKPGSFTALVTVEDMAGNFVSEIPFHFNVTTSIHSMKQLVSRFTSLGDLSGPLVPQLTNSLNQAQHQFDKGRLDHAVKHIQDFVDQLNNKAVSKYASEKAKKVLDADANDLINK